jgi:peptidoglycan/xylan/chitin deacetylase (PgdA/CDA1 family)
MNSKQLLFSSLLTALGLGLAFANARAEFPEARQYISGESQDVDFIPSALNTNKVVLTYDDGPDPVLTPKVLDLLKAHHYHATFFLIGDNITPETKPIILRAIQEGHLIGSHSMHHLDSNTMTESEFRSDLDQSITLVRQIIKESGHDQNEVYFRFPYGAYGNAKGYHHFNVIREESQKLFGVNCINFAFWNIDPSDGWGLLRPRQIYKNVFSAFDGGKRTTVEDSTAPDTTSKVVKELTIKDDITHGGVILMHDIHKQSVESLSHIYNELEKRHIEVVPLNSLPEFNFNDRTCGSKFKPL